MKHHFWASVFTLALTACGPDETISGYADQDGLYVLRTINDTTYEARATIAFPEAGTVIGEGPCNRFHAAQTVPYPWFSLGPIASTRRACPDLRQEHVYFSALANMRFAEVAGDTLILSGEDDELMVFQVE